jgi:hypothetical protein
MTTFNKKRKPMYKKFLRLKVNPLNNNKFLKVDTIKIKKKLGKKIRIYQNFTLIEKFKKKKWFIFINLLKRKNKFYQRLKPSTCHSYSVSKFASSGNSFKRKFRNDLLAKQTFNYMYGNLLKKYLKKKTTAYL